MWRHPPSKTSQIKVKQTQTFSYICACVWCLYQTQNLLIDCHRSVQYQSYTNTRFPEKIWQCVFFLVGMYQNFWKEIRSSVMIDSHVYQLQTRRNSFLNIMMIVESRRRIYCTAHVYLLNSIQFFSYVYLLNEHMCLRFPSLRLSVCTRR